MSELLVTYLADAKEQIKSDVYDAMQADEVDRFLKLSGVYLEMIDVIETARAPDPDGPAADPKFSPICEELIEITEEEVAEDSDLDLSIEKTTVTPVHRKGLKLTVRDGVDLDALIPSMIQPMKMALDLRGDGPFFYRTDLVNALDQRYTAAGIENPQKKAQNIIHHMREKQLIDVFQEEPELA